MLTFLIAWLLILLPGFSQAASQIMAEVCERVAKNQINQNYPSK